MANEDKVEVDLGPEVQPVRALSIVDVLAATTHLVRQSTDLMLLVMQVCEQDGLFDALSKQQAQQPTGSGPSGASSLEELQKAVRTKSQSTFMSHKKATPPTT